MDIKELHEKILYPIVRVRTTKAVERRKKKEKLALSRRMDEDEDEDKGDR